MVKVMVRHVAVGQGGMVDSCKTKHYEGALLQIQDGMVRLYDGNECVLEVGLLNVISGGDADLIQVEGTSMPAYKQHFLQVQTDIINKIQEARNCGFHPSYIIASMPLGDNIIAEAKLDALEAAELPYVAVGRGNGMMVVCEEEISAQAVLRRLVDAV